MSDIITLEIQGIQGIAGPPGSAIPIPTNTFLANPTNITANPIAVNQLVARTMLAIENLNNTSDINKPISTATQTALNLKANTSSLSTIALSGSASDLSSGTLPNGRLSNQVVRNDFTYANPSWITALDYAKLTGVPAFTLLGETPTTAYRGDRGKTAYDHSQTLGNPHGLAWSDISGSVPLGQLPMQVARRDQANTLVGNQRVDGILSVNTDVGGVSGSGLSFGSTSTYLWIQSFSSMPLKINPLGNNVEFGASLDVAGNVITGGVIRATSGSNYVELTGSNGSGKASINLLSSGDTQSILTATGGALAISTTIDVTGAMISTGHVISDSYIRAVGALRSSAGSHSGTGVGTVDLWSPTGSGTFIAFTETGVNNWGTLGFAAGSGTLEFRTGATSMTTGTQVFSVSPSGNITASGNIEALAAGAKINGREIWVGPAGVQWKFYRENLTTGDLRVSNYGIDYLTLSPVGQLTTPSMRVVGPDNAHLFGVSGVSYGIRMGSTPGLGAYIEGVDPTLNVAYQPLQIRGSSLSLDCNTSVTGTLTATGTATIGGNVIASGNVTASGNIKATTHLDVGAGSGLRINDAGSVSEISRYGSARPLIFNSWDYVVFPGFVLYSNLIDVSLPLQSSATIGIASTATKGGIQLNSTTGRTGYLEFYQPTNIRTGYIGYDNGNDISLANEVGGQFKTNCPITSVHSSSSTDLFTSDLTTGQFRLHKNSSTGSTKFYLNDGGVIKTSLAFT